MTRESKIVVEAFGKTWRFSPKTYCGYIKCDRLRMVFPISHIAIPMTYRYDAFIDGRSVALNSEKLIPVNNAFLCKCGNFTDDDYWYHKVFYKGKEIKNEH